MSQPIQQQGEIGATAQTNVCHYCGVVGPAPHLTTCYYMQSSHALKHQDKPPKKDLWEESEEGVRIVRKVAEEYDTSKDSEYGARGNAYRKMREQEVAEMFNKLEPGKKYEAQFETPQGTYYSTDGRWGSSPEDFGPNMTHMQGEVAAPPQTQIEEFVKRACANAPPPMDDVGGWSDVPEMFVPDEGYTIHGSELLPRDSAARKDMPIATGVLDYFPLAIAEVAKVSKIAGDKHHPGQPTHWERGKSMDHADCLMRHFLERGLIDDDGITHSAKMAWRALALLQTELENR